MTPNSIHSTISATCVSKTGCWTSPIVLMHYLAFLQAGGRHGRMPRTAPGTARLSRLFHTIIQPLSKRHCLRDKGLRRPAPLLLPAPSCDSPGSTGIRGYWAQNAQNFHHSASRAFARFWRRPVPHCKLYCAPLYASGRVGSSHYRQPCLGRLVASLMDPGGVHRQAAPPVGLNLESYKTTASTLLCAKNSASSALGQ